MSYKSRCPVRILVSKTEAVILGEGVILGGSSSKHLRMAQFGIT